MYSLMGDTALCRNPAAVYHPRTPADSPLCRLLSNHFDHFERIYDERFAKEYGFYRPVISDVVRAYLKCRDLKQGFARVRCPDCHHEYLLAFSCRAAGPGVSFLAYLSKLPCEKGCPVWRTAAGKYSLPIASPPVCIQYPDNPAQVCNYSAAQPG